MHFVQSLGCLRMLFPMAFPAQAYQVVRIKRTFRAVFKMLDVMHLNRLYPLAVSLAVLTHVSITPQDSLPHPLPLLRMIKLIVVMLSVHIPTSTAERHTRRCAARIRENAA